MWLLLDDVKTLKMSCPKYVDLKRVNNVFIGEYYFFVENDEPDFAVWVAGPGITEIARVFEDNEEARKFALLLLRAIDLDKKGLCEHEEAPYIIDFEDIYAETY